MNKLKSDISLIPIRFNDIDAFGHVNNAIYLTYFEEGRKSLFDKLTGKNWNWVDHGVIIARHDIEYLQPLQYNDEAYIETVVTKIGIKSFNVNYRIFKMLEGTEQLCTQGQSVIVCYDFNKKKTIEVPAEWRVALGGT